MDGEVAASVLPECLRNGLVFLDPDVCRNRLQVVLALRVVCRRRIGDEKLDQLPAFFFRLSCARVFEEAVPFLPSADVERNQVGYGRVCVVVRAF